MSILTESFELMPIWLAARGLAKKRAVDRHMFSKAAYRADRLTTAAMLAEYAAWALAQVNRSALAVHLAQSSLFCFDVTW